MLASSSSLNHHAPALLRGIALVAIALGVGVWGAVLLAPAPREAPPVLDAIMPQLHDTQTVASWFGGAALRVRVAAVGVIASDDGRGAALLSVDAGPVRAYRVGQSLAPGVTLHAVTAGSVSIDQDGVIEQVALRPGPASSAQGFITVPATAN